MLDTKKIAEMEQGAALLSETIPTLLWGLYEGFQAKGFSDFQSFELVKVYLSSMVKAHIDESVE